MDKSKASRFFKKFYIYFVLILIYLPLIFIVILSFSQPTAKGNINVNFTSPTFVNYLNLFKNDEFLNGLMNSVILSIIVVPISLFIGLITCLGIWKASKRTRKIVSVINTTSISSPEVITGISLALLFATTWIPLGLNLGFVTIILAHISFCVPYAIVTIYPRMAKMKESIVLASYDLGHSRTTTLFKVIIPYLMPAILSATAIVVAMSFDDFIITSLVNGSTQTIGTLIYSTRKGIKAWVVTFGAITLIITFIVVLIMTLRKYFVLKKNIKANNEKIR